MVIDPLNPPLIMPLDGYRTEFGSSQFNIENRSLIEVEKHSAFYKHVFEGRRTLSKLLSFTFLVYPLAMARIFEIKHFSYLSGRNMAKFGIIRGVGLPSPKTCAFDPQIAFSSSFN